MRTSESTAAIYAAIAAAQGAMKSAAKDNTNPAFRSKYADLASHVEAIRPAFAAQKLGVLQELTSNEHGVLCITRFIHASGEWIEFDPLFVPASKHDAHGYGSACTYARRFSLSAAAGTVADDDDGNAAVESKPAAVPEPIGYQDWFTDLSALAETADVDTFRDSYKASPRKHRDYLEKTHKGDLDALVERAKKNPAMTTA